MSNNTKLSEDIIAQGDVAGLLAWMRNNSPDTWPKTIMNDLATAIRQLGKDDTSAVVELAFGEIIGMATTLLIRSQLHIDNRLRECDQCDGDRTHMPEDLTNEGWITRVEKLGRFICEVATIRSRVTHVGQINEQGIRKMRKSGDSTPGSPLAYGQAETPSGENPLGNGRLHPQERRFQFS